MTRLNLFIKHFRVKYEPVSYQWDRFLEYLENLEEFKVYNELKLVKVERNFSNIICGVESDGCPCMIAVPNGMGEDILDYLKS